MSLFNLKDFPKAEYEFWDTRMPIQDGRVFVYEGEQYFSHKGKYIPYEKYLKWKQAEQDAVMEKMQIDFEMALLFAEHASDST